MSGARRLTLVLAVLASLSALAAGAATVTPVAVTFDLTTLGTLSLAAGQTKTISLGGSTTVTKQVTAKPGGGTTVWVTETIDPLVLTLQGLTAKGADGLQTQTVKVGGNTVSEIKNYNTATIPGKGGVQQDIFQSALTFSASGAGVSNSREGLLGLVFKDSPTVDGGGGNVDFLVAGLSQTATLTGASLTDFNVNGGGKSRSQFEWAWDSSADGSIGNGDILSGKVNLSAVTAATFASTASDAFAFSATGGGDSWRLASLAFSYVPTIRYTYSSVPLPTPGVLLLGALAGFGMLRRRRGCRRRW